MIPDALDDWQDWGLELREKPGLISEIEGGQVNRHYLIEIDRQRLVLRRNNPNSAALGINREQEKMILAAVGQAGFSAPVIYCSVAEGILITDYIDGSHWQKSTLQDTEKRSRLIDALQSIHALSLNIPAFDYRQHAENYWSRLIEYEPAPPVALQQRREMYLHKVENIPTEHFLCHHDPNPSNIIESSGQIYFLDWEYAGSGWPAFDFAALAREWDLDQDILSEISGLEAGQLSDALFMYKYLCELWSKIQFYQGS